jgi:hypothetical protein
MVVEAFLVSEIIWIAWLIKSSSSPFPIHHQLKAHHVSAFDSNALIIS